MKVWTLLSKAGFNLFFVLMLVMVGLAYLFPVYGSDHGPLPLKEITTYGVSLIFFFYGLKLDPGKLWAGLSNWKLHLVIQLTTFLFFPVVAILLYYAFFNGQYELWWLGSFYLAALPSTVSSSVVMVSIAGGNISAAIFNASISSLIGIFLTPVWMSLFVNTTNFSQNSLTDIILNLCLQILLPVIIGLALHKKFGYITDRLSNVLKYFDQTIILLIVYRAFSESFINKMFQGNSTLEIVTLGIIMLSLFLLMFLIMQGISNALKFSLQDRITIIFCGSKKSLVQGAVMAQVLFPNTAAIGILMLPLMLYHALQLLAGSIIANRIGKTQ